ncbi:unnamed protein product [Timema podura]|uniref:Uncharacterized protein n=1 Tax=Timema podura TaxID=61482 RepID=A0ABN7NE61_TIMPD|nr:unnamed protein product [Timema podura]
MLAQTVSVRKSSRNWEHAQRAPSLMCMVSVWPSVERYTPSPDTVLIFMCGSACGDEGQGRDVTGAGRGAAVFNVLINSRTKPSGTFVLPVKLYINRLNILR